MFRIVRRKKGVLQIQLKWNIFSTCLGCLFGLRYLLCFSGGYNIKTGPGCSIELMKFDMGGSAAVLGAAKALGQIKPAGVEASHFLVIYV